jgi:hypothetical protein
MYHQSLAGLLAALLESLRKNSKAAPLGLKPAKKRVHYRSGKPLRHPKPDFFCSL